MIRRFFMGVGVLLAICLVPVAGNACGGGKGDTQTSSDEPESSEVLAQADDDESLRQSEPKPTDSEQ